MKTIHHVFDTTAPRDTVFAALTTTHAFRFELGDKGDGTIVRFWQDYARELSDDDYGTYNFNWCYYLESLRLFSIPAAASLSRPDQ